MAHSIDTKYTKINAWIADLTPSGKMSTYKSIWIEKCQNFHSIYAYYISYMLF